MMPVRCAVAMLLLVSTQSWAQAPGWPPAVDIPISRSDLSDPLKQQNYEIMAECEGHLESQSDILDIALLDLDYFQKTESGLSNDEYNFIESLKGKIITSGDSSRQAAEEFRKLRDTLIATDPGLDHAAAREDYERAKALWAPYYERSGGEQVDAAVFDPVGICVNAFTILSSKVDAAN